MGIFGVLTTAVAGLQAQSYALENISGNIANSQTTGYKRVDTSFVDLIPDQPAQHELAGSVSTYSRLTTTLPGSLQPTGVSTNIALNGEGFLVVQKSSGQSNNQPVFSSADLYTRRGDFSVDKSGYLVNGAGYYLKGTAIDRVTGELTSSGSAPIQISNDILPAKRTTVVELSGSFPTTPATTDQRNGIANGDILDPTAFANDPTTGNPTVANRYVSADDESKFLDRTVEGPRVRIYNDVGVPIDVSMRLAKLSSSPANWNLFYLENDAATGTAAKWRNVGTAVTFDSAGKMTSPSPATLSIPSLTVNGESLGAALTVDMRSGGGVTQSYSQDGLFQQSMLSQNGNATGTLESLAVNAEGRVVGSYSNGLVIPLAQITVAQFNADNMLKRSDGGVYEQTLESGSPIYSLNGATVVGGSVEVSNTDIAEEFSKMIVTQQAYSANTRVMTTAQQMLADVINVVR